MVKKSQVIKHIEQKKEIKEKQEIRAKQKEIFEKAKADIEEAKLHAAYRNIDSLK